MVTHDDRRLTEVHSFVGNIAEARSRNTGLQSREAQHMIDKQMKLAPFMFRHTAEMDIAPHHRREDKN